jgi:hypothetical protein
LKTNKWERKAELLVGLSGHFGAIYQNELIIGYGWKSGRFTNSIWKYKYFILFFLKFYFLFFFKNLFFFFFRIDTNEWFKLKHFSEKRDSCAFVRHENSLLIFGGYELKRSNDLLLFKFGIGDWSRNKHIQFPQRLRKIGNFKILEFI